MLTIIPIVEYVSQDPICTKLMKQNPYCYVNDYKFSHCNTTCYCYKNNSYTCINDDEPRFSLSLMITFSSLSGVGAIIALIIVIIIAKYKNEKSLTDNS